MDVIWLQRDLGLYVVSLFDTFHACRALGYPQKSLAYLLRRFAGVDAAKQYQTADWRIRPLPEEMFDYARSDTHYLLFIYDNMRNELCEKSSPSITRETLVEAVMQKSKEVALQRYEYPIYDFERGSGSTGWYNLLSRTPALFTCEQFAVFRALHQWRDHIARQEDESVQSVMPRHVLYNIARETPMDMPSLLGCSHPMSKLFQLKNGDLLEVIKRAKAHGTTGPEMKDLMQEIESQLDHTTRVKEVPVALCVDDVKAHAQLLHPVERKWAALPLRSYKSHFWGPDMPNTIVDELEPHYREHALALPLPQLTVEAYGDTNNFEALKHEENRFSPGTLADEQYVEVSPLKKNSIFTLNEDGGSRKRKATSNGEAMQRSFPQGAEMTSVREETESHPKANSESQRKLEKAQRKAKKKRSNEVVKDETNGATTHDGEYGEIFDYVSAPSVLHAKQSIVDGKVAASREINPYAKSMDAPKGMRKSKKETAGRSHTFKA